VDTSSKHIIRLLEAAGWRKVRQKGSHVAFQHAARPGTVVVPHPRKDTPVGTVRSIERQSGVRILD
jgi:predicted RNA binding protein YcfA (HicA-like mRNA interferase family)